MRSLGRRRTRLEEDTQPFVVAVPASASWTASAVRQRLTFLGSLHPGSPLGSQKPPQASTWAAGQYLLALDRGAHLSFLTVYGAPCHACHGTGAGCSARCGAHTQPLSR